MSDELKPCPNPECTEPQNLIRVGIAGNRRSVHCLCGVWGPDAKTVEEARRLWNLLPRAEPIANSERAREEAGAYASPYDLTRRSESEKLAILRDIQMQLGIVPLRTEEEKRAREEALGGGK